MTIGAFVDSSSPKLVSFGVYKNKFHFNHRGHGVHGENLEYFLGNPQLSLSKAKEKLEMLFVPGIILKRLPVVYILRQLI